jgi:oxaloacetate decarboxylase alpha subunit
MPSNGQVRFVDTTLRDGQTSLWATGMTTEMMRPVADGLERAGYAAVEILGGAFFKKVVRDLREDPFERVRVMKAAMPSTPLRLIHSRHALAFQITPPALYELLVRRLVAHGVEEVRVSDPSNSPSSWAVNIAAAQKAGMRATVNLVFSVSPKHTDAYYAEKARAAAALPVYAICVKDPGGLMLPERARTLIPAVQREVGNIPLEFHGHCNNGQWPLNALEAIKLGIGTIDCAIPPLANGA